MYYIIWYFVSKQHQNILCFTLFSIEFKTQDYKLHQLSKYFLFMLVSNIKAFKSYNFIDIYEIVELSWFKSNILVYYRQSIYVSRNHVWNRPQCT